MTMQASTPKAMWLIARLRLQRLWNMVIGFRFKPAKGAKSRGATGMKQGAGWVVSALAAAFMLFALVSVARQSVINAQCWLVPASECVRQDSARRHSINDNVAIAELLAAPFAPQVSLALGFQLSVLLVVSFLIPLGSREIAAADWDLEWLVTLPASRWTLMWGRVFERTIVNPTGWIFLLPFCAMLAWFSGYRWSAPLIGVIGALVLLPMAAMLRTVVDTGLRMSLPPSTLRNLQACTGVIGLPFMYFALALGTARNNSFVLDVVRDVPGWLAWTPGGLMVSAINAGTLAQAAPAAALLALQLAVILGGGMLVLRHQLRAGVVGAGARESGRRRPQADNVTGGWLARLLPASPIKRRELKLLARDRNFLVQSLLLPIVIFGSQLLVNGSTDVLSDLASSPTVLGGFAFGIGSYMLMLSAFQTINNEGQSLWMLYTFPRPIEHVLREKAQFWAVLALVYPTIILGIVLWARPENAMNTLSMFAVVVAGIPIFSAIAVSLGVFASNPLSQDVRTKIKVSYTYLYLMLSGLYVFAVTTTVLWYKLVLIVLMAALAIALWQKTRDRLPYLLDPAMVPPARVSTSDGLIAALLFFVLQAGLLLLLSKVGKVGPAEAIVLAFSAAGLLVFALMRLVLWLSKSQGVPVMVTGRLSHSIAWGLGGGALAAVVGAVYVVTIGHLGLFPEAPGAGQRSHFALHWLFLLAVVAAPLCEEFIFRGLIFGGLRRSMGLMPGIVMSAALFAIVHAPISMLPVFVLGLITAYAYERNRSLLAPVLIHAVYNGAMLALQLLR